MSAVRLDVALLVLWLGLMAIAIAYDWPVGLVVFFAFAAGERWCSLWRPR